MIAARSIVFAAGLIALPCCFVATVGRAEAQSRRAPRPSPSDSTPEYRAAIEEALSEFDAQRFAEARAYFLQAHALEPNARTLRGIGMCAFELSDYVGAIVSFEEALASDARPLESRMRTQTEQLLGRARTFVGRLALNVTPATARVLVDGQPPVTRDGLVLLNPGDHEIRVEADGFAPDTRRVRVEAAAQASIDVVLAPPAPLLVPSGTVAIEASGEAARTETPRHRAHPVDVPTGIAYGVGGAGLVLAVSFGIRALVLSRDHSNGCLAAGICTEASLDAQDRSALTADISLAIGIAGTTTGLLLQFLRHPRDRDGAPTLSTFVAPRSAGVAVRGRF